MLAFKNYKRPLLASVMGIFLMSQAQACGPFFSSVLVLDRKTSLTNLPSGDAYFEVGKLLPKKEFTFIADESSSVGTVELVGLSDKEAELLKAMRIISDPALAYEAGKGLPEAIRLYTAAAIAYNREITPRENSESENNSGENTTTAIQSNIVTVDEKKPVASGSENLNSHNLNFAREKFLAVLALPDSEKKLRAVWAAYMLGKMATYDQNIEEAAKYFSMVRELAAKGNNDNLGLAVSSYGEEARLYYLIATGEVPESEKVSVQNAFLKATELYAQQAAYGSNSAYDSLRMTIGKVIQQDGLIAPLMQDALIQQLVFAYAFSGYFDENARVALFTLLDQQKVEHILNADVVAAFAYRAGRYELAEHYAAKSKTPLAAWVNAKLALQKGDQPRALAAYAEAIKSFPESESWTSSMTSAFYNEGDFGVTPHCLVNTEMGLLQLGRNEYVQALNYLYAGAKDYWMDAAYVAERILTTDELKTFVEQHVPEPAPIQKSSDSAEDPFTSPDYLIRDLLARRLMREKRYGEALPFFKNPEVRKKAKDYMADLEKAKSPFQPKTARAKGLYKASLLARYDGMDLMGFEGAPDFKVWDGMFEYGTPEDITPDGNIIGAAEKLRFDATKANPEKRFHYRFIAADLANQAADLLPTSSQAFAAVLCEGTNYLLARYPEDALPLYKRYIKEGAYVPWGADFGQACPEPEFSRAFFQYPLEKFAKLKRHFN